VVPAKEVSSLGLGDDRDGLEERESVERDGFRERDEEVSRLHHRH